MPSMATRIDPLAAYLAAVARRSAGHPVPLVATHIDVTIRGGLAFVATRRTFRNAEPKPIEATMTFPVPVDATLCALAAEIDGRALTAKAYARTKARAHYEAAVDRGRSAVLHEELLKGIHQLSVAHVRPGGQIAVTDTWTAPLSFVDEMPRLRIPTTVGEIYGRSPLSHEQAIGIACADGTATLLNAGEIVDGRARVELDAPIDVVVAGWRKCKLAGVAAAGREVVLDIGPAAEADASLAVDVLFDRSGSMDGRATGYAEADASKFAVAKQGLASAVRARMAGSDRLRLWAFDDSVRLLGEAAGAACEALVEAIPVPGGGTEIGQAFAAAIAKKAENVVIVTDGQSWAFDPQAIARTGMRVTAVLIGEEAIEAGIAHLAGMTGGQVFVATGSEAAGAVAAALAAARMPHHAAARIAGAPKRVEVFRRGARVIATWGDKAKVRSSVAARQIGATAAMLAVPLMDEAPAAKLAEAEGIVCHLTSLVLVDKTGARHGELPAVRKVEPSPPRTSRARASGMALRSLGGADLLALERARAGSRMKACEDEDAARRSSGSARRYELDTPDPIIRPAPPPPPPPPVVESAAPRCLPDLRRLVDRIDWGNDPEALRRGDLSGLAPQAVVAIERAARLPEIVALAQRLGLVPVVLVVGLIANAARGISAAAGRLARALLGHVAEADLAEALRAVGL